MNTLVLSAHLVNHVIASVSSKGATDALEVVGTVHRIIGALIIVTAVLLVATAGPRWRSRATAIIVALVMLAVVATGCAEPAAAATAAGNPGESSGDSLMLAVTIAAAVAVIALFVAVARLAFWVFTIVARALEVVLVIRHAALITSALTMAFVVLAVRA